MNNNQITVLPRQPPCPYCGSIETNGITCLWCHNKITEYIESEEITMTLELKFTGLTPEQALKLIGAATGAKAEINQNEPVSTAPIQPPIQAIPTAPAVTIPTAPPVTQPTAPATPIAPPTTPAPAVPPTTIPTAPPTAVKQYTADELAVAARPLCETPDGRDKLLNLLHSFSYTDSTGAVRTVQSIRDMPPEQYPALANGIRQLGGRI